MTVDVGKSGVEQVCRPDTVMAAGLHSLSIHSSEGVNPTSTVTNTEGVSFVETFALG